MKTIVTEPVSASGASTTAATPAATGVTAQPAVRRTEIIQPVALPPIADRYSGHELSFVLAMLVLNGFVIWSILRIRGSLSLSSLLAEKDPAAIAAKAEVAIKAVEVNTLAVEAHVSHLRTLVGGSPPPPPEQVDVPSARPDQSSSRLAGLLGSFVLVAMTWALANFIVWAAFFDESRIAPTLDSIGQFYLAASTLFAPYAVNQLSAAFRQTVTPPSK